MRTLFALGLFVTVAFQACGKANFSGPGGADSSASSADGSNNAAGGATDGSGNTVICDPLSGGSCSTGTVGGGGSAGSSSGGGTASGSLPAHGTGLIGSIYYLNQGSSVEQYLTQGERLPITLLMSNLNIPDRAWTDGFPGANGSPLSEPDGTVLNEWFLLDLNGYFELPDSMPEGQYQFATNSDDGSILYLSGNEIINNDGNHSQTYVCQSNLVNLVHGTKYPMHLDYYQGPRDEIALQVFLRPQSSSGSSCDASGNWTIIPASSLSY